jgi:hypothetical protein
MSCIKIEIMFISQLILRETAFIGLLGVFYVCYLLLVTAAMLDDLWDI